MRTVFLAMAWVRWQAGMSNEPHYDELSQQTIWSKQGNEGAHMMSPKKGSRQAMKQATTMKTVLQTRRTIVFLKLHTGARMLPNVQS